MKTKELIRRLQEADPSGEIECCVGNADIYFLETYPAYYDGCLQVLKRDPALEGHCYNIVGAEVHGAGQKVKLHTMSIRDCLLDDPEMPVEFVGETANRHMPGYVEECRNEMRAICAEVDADHAPSTTSTTAPPAAT